MIQPDLIDNFFSDEEDYITFLVGLKERTIPNDDRTCFAQLTKQGDCYIYKLALLPNDRTAALGGHVDACDGCGNISISYNSCRNRHCPKCQGHKREEWIQKREADLFPCTYFHLVFTLPTSSMPWRCNSRR